MTKNVCIKKENLGSKRLKDLPFRPMVLPLFEVTHSGLALGQRIFVDHAAISRRGDPALDQIDPIPVALGTFVRDRGHSGVACDTGKALGGLGGSGFDSLKGSGPFHTY